MRRGKGNLTREQIKRIVELREVHGQTFEEIARAVGCSESAVRWHCCRQGVEGPRRNRLPATPSAPVTILRGGRPVRLFTEDEDAELLRLEAAGLSYAEIGRLMNRAPITVRNRLMALARREERREAR